MVVAAAAAAVVVAEVAAVVVLARYPDVELCCALSSLCGYQ